MLDIILGILGSGSVGSIIGLAGGYMNRRLDLEVERIKMADRQAEREHDLKRMDSERATIQVEYSMRGQLADKENAGKAIEADAAIEVAGYGAMSDSYNFAAPATSDGLVDKASKIIRPVVTVAFLVLIVYVFGKVNGMMARLYVVPDPGQVVALWIDIIKWMLFIGGTVIGWWFAMRPGKSAK